MKFEELQSIVEANTQAINSLTIQVKQGLANTERRQAQFELDRQENQLLLKAIQTNIRNLQNALMDKGIL